jgi:hypothetical protein
MIASRSVLLRMKDFSDERWRKTRNIHFVFSNFCQISFRFWNTAGQATDDYIIRHMRFTCWITTTKDTHSEYVMLITFPQKQWLRERASVLRYAYITCLVNFKLGGKYSDVWRSREMYLLFPNFRLNESELSASGSGCSTPVRITPIIIG